MARVSRDGLTKDGDAPRKKCLIELLIAGALGKELPG